jgi:type II secretory pathway component PulF
MTAPTPLEYRTPTSVPRRQVFSVTAFLIVGLPILTIYAVMAFVVPKFGIIFRDFGTTLPTPTYALLGLSRAVMRFGWIPLMTLPPILVIAGCA